MSLGIRNPLPFCLGAGPTPTEKIHDALVSAMGKTSDGANQVVPPGGIRDFWIWCKAAAIARACSVKDLAVANFFPQAMSVEVEQWLELLLAPQGVTEEDSREVVLQRITFEPNATGASIQDQLIAIDPAFRLVTVLWDEAFTAQSGKYLRPAGDIPDYGGDLLGPHLSQPWFNFNDAAIEHVQYVLPPGATTIPQDSITKAESMLNEIVPYWKEWSIGNLAVAASGGGPGFALDGGVNGDSLLDQTWITDG